MLDAKYPILVRGAGDIATGTARRLHRAGFRVVCTEVAAPLAVRRKVAFSDAVFDGAAVVEGVDAKLCEPDEISKVLERRLVAVVVDPTAAIRKTMRFAALVDARMLKHKPDTTINDAPIVIGLGPGFTAGINCHAFVETLRGHDLGRACYHGSAAPDTGVPGERGGYTTERVIRAPDDGEYRAAVKIGDKVDAGEVVAFVNDTPVRSQIAGIVRGMLRDGLSVAKGLKIGDVDAEAKPEHCVTVSDRANAIAGGVLEAILHLVGPAASRKRNLPS